MLNLSAVDENKDIATKEYADTKALKTEAIKNITRSGTTFTATRCDNTTFTFTQQDNNSVTGVKGNSESSYRTGNVNLTAAHIGAAEASHTHSTQQLYWPNSLVGMNDVTLRSMVDTTRANRLAFLPADQIIIEKTTDGGATWVDAGVSDSTKVALFSQTRPTVNLPRLNDTTRSEQCGLRITFTAMKYNVPNGTAETAKYNYWTVANVLSQERYCYLDCFYFWLGSNGDKIGVKVECANASTPTTWMTAFDDPTFGLQGYSGNSYIKVTQRTFGGATTQTSQPWNWRITLMTMYANGSSAYNNNAQQIFEIRGYGTTWWGGQNNLMKNDHLYSWDYNKNATFPAQVTATQFNGALNGTATNASKVNNLTVQTAVPANAVFTDTTYSAATQSAAGLMSASDKTKLDGIATGATANAGTITGITTSSPLSGSGTSGSVALSHANSGVTAASKGDTSAQTPGFGGTFKVPSGTVNATGHLTAFADHTVTIPSAAATTSAAGLMSAADKTKLDGIATGAQVNSVTGVKGNSESSYRTGNVNITAANVGAAASSHTHGNITNAGDITATAPTIATSDKIIINDESASKITNGPAFDTTDTSTFLRHDGTWASAGGGGTTVDIPTGSITMFAGSTAPTGYLICDGSAVSRTTYSALFAVIGTTYGTGDGSSTFNLPNLQGKFALGKSSSYALGSTGGAATVTLSIANLPAHTHGSKSLTGETSAWGDTGLIGGTATPSGIISKTGSYSYGPDWAQAAASKLKIDATHEHDSVGSGTAHNNMPPYQTVNYIIKT